MTRQRTSLRRLARVVAPLALAAASWLTAPAAHAAGALTAKNKELQEEHGGWKLMLTIKVPRKPITPHVPFRFIFTPLVIYETYVDDTSPNEKTRAVSQGRDVQPSVESLDVDFSNARGDIFDTTKFDFVIKRDKGYYAGDYKLEVRDDANNMIGSPVTLKLAGKNDVVDRRAMIIADNKKKKVPPTETKTEPASDAGGADAQVSAPVADAGAQPPPEVEKKSGGCGCEMPGAPSHGSALALLGVGIIAAATRRRRAR